MENVELYDKVAILGDSGTERRTDLQSATPTAVNVVRCDRGSKRSAETTEKAAKRAKSAATAFDSGAAAVTSSSHTNVSCNTKADPFPFSTSNSGSTAYFTALPIEILDHIACYLPRSSLFCLSLTSKKMNCAAVPHLYGQGILLDMSNRARRTFVQRITQHPELAKCVKHIEVVHCLQTGQEAQLLDAALKVATDIRRLSVTDTSRRVTRKHEDQDFPWVEMLVDASKSTSVGSLAGLTKTFTKLKTISITLDPHIRGWLRLEKFSAVLCLPSLEDITLRGFVEGDRIPNWSCPAKSSNIKRLKLDLCFLHSEIVVQLLSSCKIVTHFSYMYSSYDNFSPFDSDADPKSIWAYHSWEDIGNGLRLHEQSLEVLEVFYEIDMDMMTGARSLGFDVVDPEHLGSLEDFPVLKELTAPLDALVPASPSTNSLAERLPNSLQSLKVRIDDTTQTPLEACSTLISALAHYQNEPGLREVRVSIGDGIDEAELKLADAVKLLEAVEVSIQVIWDKEDDDEASSWTSGDESNDV